jgi:CubicO group peptidase (beta-lactamase class C family)
MNHASTHDRTSFPTEGLKRDLDVLLDHAVLDQALVGAIVLVSMAGEIEYERAAGFADREASVPVTQETIFRWASLTKPLVSACALALLDQKVISLDDPITKFLPGFAPRLPDGSTPTITISHLLTHTAGMTYRLSEVEGGPYHRANVSDGLDQPGLSIDENLRRIASVHLASAPGSAWAYSVATDVLGEVIARAAGTPLPMLVDRLVVQPLGLKSSDFSVTQRDRLAAAYADGKPAPTRMAAHHLVPFWNGAISFAPDRMFDPKSFPSGGAGMSGTATDFLRFLEAVRTGGEPILSKPSTDLLTSTATGDLQSFAPGWGWSMGWAILRDPTLTGTPQSPGTWLWGVSTALRGSLTRSENCRSSS